MKPAFNPLDLLDRFNSSKLYHDICRQHGLVYFGHVNKYDDEHQLVRGVTFSHNHQDDHYLVGTVHGYDVIMLERTDVIKFPGRPTEKYRWVIAQFDLDERLNLAQTFIDAKHHEAGFYSTLFAKFTRLSPAEHVFDDDYDRLFTDRFHAYTPPDAIDNLPRLLTPDVAAVMAHHFAHFDVEWHQDRLLIYSTGRTVTKNLLEMMIREGIWLAAEIEKNAANLHSAPET